MPTRRKSSPTKAKKSPTKKSRSASRTRSRSRSTSQSRKSVGRTRSRSSSRRTVTTTVTQVKEVKKSPVSKSSSPVKETITSASHGTLVKSSLSPSKAVSKSVQQEDPIVPTRVSRRIIEKTTYQVSKTSSTDKGDMKTTTASPSKAAPQSKGMGYTAIIAILFFLAVTYLVALSCTKSSCSMLRLPKCPAMWKSFISLEVMGFITAFHIAMAVLYIIPVGSVEQGLPLKDGRRLNYRCNAWLSLLAVAAAFGYCVQSGWPVKMSYVHDHFLQFVTADVIFSLLMAFGLHVLVRKAPAVERSDQADGTFWNDFVVGRVLHPRIGDFDFKSYLVRSGMIGWLAIDWMYMMDRFKTTQSVEPALVLLVLCHTLYVTATFRKEEFMLTSNDFVKEGLGYMLCWVTMVFLPYVMSLQTRFLYLYPQQGITNKYALAAFFILNLVGLMFYIGGNWQKMQFRKNPYNPELSHLSSIPTSTGKRLLCSGWWGIVRRPNYLGDILMALAWSLPCGFNYGSPYLYPMYLVPLLVYRVVTDEKDCHQRYGDAWNKYTEVVRYRLIPYVF